MSLHKVKITRVYMNPLFDPNRDQTALGEEAEPFIIIESQIIDQLGMQILANKSGIIEHRYYPSEFNPKATYQQMKTLAKAFAQHIGKIRNLECNSDRVL